MSAQVTDVVLLIGRVDQKLTALHQRQDKADAELKRVGSVTDKLSADMVGPLEAWQATVGGLKVLGWLGSAAKWITAIGGGFAVLIALWYAVTHGGWFRD